MYAFLLFFACNSEIKTADSASNNIIQDNDGDGFADSEDCDDNDSSINPSAEEICDGLDNNCDGTIDEDVLSVFYADADEDGFGNSERILEACSVPDGYIANGSDCDDLDAYTYPSAEEICDGKDNNCNGDIDEDIAITHYVDDDGDGFGDENQPVFSCSAGPGIASVAGDCDDLDASINPLEQEVCDERDNNCNGSIDEAVTSIYYLDQDEDGYGDIEQELVACSAPAGYVTNSDDCDDLDSFVYLDATEMCDFQDNDCDGQTDEDDAADVQIWFGDGDGDGFGTPTLYTTSCFPPTNYVSSSDDCDDGDASIHPNAAEVCDGLDNNCDAFTDDLDPNIQNQSTFYLDHDEDGYGDPSFLLERCLAPSNYVTDNSDCNDLNDSIYPGAQEQCGTIDNNCDGVIGDLDPSADSTSFVWYEDVDDDGFGNSASSINACIQPSGYVTDGSDCDDGNDAIHPSGIETCDTIDNDCDGFIDDDDSNVTGKSTFYLDHDSDGYGDDSLSVDRCLAPTSYITDNTDCDDLDDTTYPNAPLGCDEQDHDCDGVSDGDLDGDGFYSLECGALDCDDNNASVFPNSGCPMGESCLDALSYDSALVSGSYLIDPDGYNQGNSAFEVFCEMDTAGGGWTLIAVNDGGSWDSDVVINDTEFGSPSLGSSFKGRGWNELPFSDLMFHNDDMFAAYDDVSNGVMSYNSFSNSIPLHNCGTDTPYEYSMTEGTLSNSVQTGTGNLCSTNLYIHPADQDGTYFACSLDNESYGPTWSMNYNNGCPIDDPSLSNFFYMSSNNPWYGSSLQMWAR